MSSQQETMVRTYKNSGDFQKDAKKLSKKGWSVLSTTEHQPSSGIGRKMTIGLGALVIKPKKEIVVTYSRVTG